MGTKNLKIIIFAGLCIVINIAGSFLALMLRLPIYFDTVGTILCSLICGPVYGAMTGGLTNIVVGITFDPTSLYYLPTQVCLGILTGFLFKNSKYKFFPSLGKVVIITISCSIISSLITTFAFSGITSSGSAYIVSALRAAGSNILTSVFSVQIVTDLIDKLFSFWICFLLIRYLPKHYLTQLK